MIAFNDFSELSNAAGMDLGSTDYVLISQEMINQFAHITKDDQWIHTNPDIAALQSPYGCCVAQGFLTLSLLSHLVSQLCFIKSKMCINYGFNQLRFEEVVLASNRVRLCASVRQVRMIRATNAFITLDVTVEIENKKKPALKAEWMLLAINH